MFVEIHLDDQGKVKQYFKRKNRPAPRGFKNTKEKFILKMEEPNTPFDDIVMEKDVLKWKFNRDTWIDKYVRPTREPLMQKALNKIDQYRNETEQLDYRIITERSISDEKYQEWLTYLQDLRDITDTIEYGNEQWPEEPK